MVLFFIFSMSQGHINATGYIIVSATIIIVGNGLDRSADFKPTSDTFGTVRTVPYIIL